MNNEEVEEDVPDEIHYANFAELQQLRKELNSLLVLSDALGSILATNSHECYRSGDKWGSGPLRLDLSRNIESRAAGAPADVRSE